MLAETYLRLRRYEEAFACFEAICLAGWRKRAQLRAGTIRAPDEESDKDLSEEEVAPFRLRHDAAHIKYTMQVDSQDGGLFNISPAGMAHEKRREVASALEGLADELNKSGFAQDSHCRVRVAELSPAQRRTLRTCNYNMPFFVQDDSVLFPNDDVKECEIVGSILNYGSIGGIFSCSCVTYGSHACGPCTPHSLLYLVPSHLHCLTPTDGPVTNTAIDWQQVCLDYKVWYTEKRLRL
jgi:hypothetical protein